jgi:glycosyltransferase involved in cell wall biosynthesis
MKIAIDARGISWYHGTGIGTYTENLLRNLFKIDNNNNYHLYWSGNNYDKFEKDNWKIVMTSKRHQRFFQQHYFPENLQNEAIDIYHIPQNGIGLKEEINCAKVVTIHDLIPYIMPETVGKGYLSKFIREMPTIINNSQGILTVSEYSKNDILKFFPIDKNKIFVTPLAANEHFRTLDKEKCKSALKNKYNITKPFVLYIGGFSDRKNVHSLIEAFSKIYKHLNEEHNLIILGSYRDSSQRLVKLVETLEMNSKIIFTGFIPEDELPMFYNAADIFVYPSLYEGFGLPPLEAMNCGTPVITSNVTSIPEVVGDAGILINPNNPIELQSEMINLLNNESLRKELSEKGLKRSKLFTWKKTAKKTLDAYKKIAEQRYSNQ